jgi:hypothetical protein
MACYPFDGKTGKLTIWGYVYLGVLAVIIILVVFRPSPSSQQNNVTVTFNSNGGSSVSSRTVRSGGALGTQIGGASSRERV